jgi:hypothetical protein
MQRASAVRDARDGRVHVCLANDLLDDPRLEHRRERRREQHDQEVHSVHVVSSLRAPEARVNTAG